MPSYRTRHALEGRLCWEGGWTGFCCRWRKWCGYTRDLVGDVNGLDGLLAVPVAVHHGGRMVPRSMAPLSHLLCTYKGAWG